MSQVHSGLHAYPVLTSLWHEHIPLFLPQITPESPLVSDTAGAGDALVSQELTQDCFPSLRRLMEATDINQVDHASEGIITDCGTC